MSTIIMAACWPLQMATLRKFVLLSLADQANDEGVCWPKVDTICKRTCASPRAVQLAMRWLELAGAVVVERRQRGNGSSASNLYTVTPDGFDPAKADASDDVHEAEQVPGAPAAALPAAPQCGGGEGARGAPYHPAPNAPPRVHDVHPYPAPNAPHEPSLEPSLRTNTPQPPDGGASDAGPVNREGAGAEPGAKRRKAKPVIELKTWLAECKAAGVKPIPPTDRIYDYAEQVGLPEDLLLLCWREFVRRRGNSNKRQADWPATFRNAVECNWYGLWFFGPDGRCDISSRGRQARALHEAKQAVAT